MSASVDITRVGWDWLVRLDDGKGRQSCFVANRDGLHYIADGEYLPATTLIAEFLCSPWPHGLAEGHWELTQLGEEP